MRRKLYPNAVLMIAFVLPGIISAAQTEQKPAVAPAAPAAETDQELTVVPTTPAEQSGQGLTIVPTTPTTSTTPSAAKPAAAPVAAKPPSGPTDPKAQKTFDEGKMLEKMRKYAFALDNFRKADKQDGGKCIPCEMRAYNTALELHDYKAAREEAAAILENVNSDQDKAQAHILTGKACLFEGQESNHEKPFEAADDEFQMAMKIAPNRSDCIFSDGLALAHLKRDGDARERFEQYLKKVSRADLNYDRAQRFAEHPELARARVAPNFEFTTFEGKTVTLESLTGKVVLIDFWATWCGPCREALPRVQKIAEKFQGQPFQVVSISLDKDQNKWLEFVKKNNMTWMQYRDGSSATSIATIFGVKAIPATFTIDADGVLQDQHVGDADIEGKIKKLIARANELASRKHSTAASAAVPAATPALAPAEAANAR